jgi:hypothetical protein
MNVRDYDSSVLIDLWQGYDGCESGQYFNIPGTFANILADIVLWPGIWVQLAAPILKGMASTFVNMYVGSSLVHQLCPLIFGVEYRSPWCPDSCSISATQKFTHPHWGKWQGEPRQLVVSMLCCFIYTPRSSCVSNRCQQRVTRRCEQSNQYVWFLCIQILDLIYI